MLLIQGMFITIIVVMTLVNVVTHVLILKTWVWLESPPQEAGIIGHLSNTPLDLGHHLIKFQRLTMTWVLELSDLTGVFALSDSTWLKSSHMWLWAVPDRKFCRV